MPGARSVSAAGASWLIRAVRRSLLPYDTRSRHAIAARLVGEPSTILDVGGVRGLLALFAAGAEVVTVNVEEPADVLFGGGRLPFADGSFDAATSLDVLEHLPPAERAGHLAELARVARRIVVLSCPLGTDEHVKAEEELSRWYCTVTGAPHRYLEEHLVNGLPTATELHRLAEAAGLGAELVYHGDYRDTNDVFRLGVRARHRRRPDLAVRYLAGRLTASRTSDELRSAPASWTNRVFLVARTNAGADA
jgi:hypothetical protein